MNEIDPRDFGRLEAKVEALEVLVEAQSAKIDSLLELANQSRGGFWVGMVIASALGAIGTLIIKFVFGR
jgi:hypothetical protein